MPLRRAGRASAYMQAFRRGRRSYGSFFFLLYLGFNRLVTRLTLPQINPSGRKGEQIHGGARFTERKGGLVAGCLDICVILPFLKKGRNEGVETPLHAWEVFHDRKIGYNSCLATKKEFHSKMDSLSTSQRVCSVEYSSSRACLPLQPGRICTLIPRNLR